MKIRLAECFLESLMNEPIKYTSAELDLDTIDSYPIDNKLACDHNENVYIQADRDMLDYLEILQNLPSPCDESGKNGSEEKTEKLYFIRPQNAVKSSCTLPQVAGNITYISVLGSGSEEFSKPFKTFSLEPLEETTQIKELWGEICLCRISKEKFTFAVLPCKHMGEEKV